MVNPLIFEVAARRMHCLNAYWSVIISADPWLNLRGLSKTSFVPFVSEFFSN